MKNILTLGTLLISLSLLSACTEDGQTHPELITSDFHDCYNSKPWDSASMANQLVGSWKFIEQGCIVNSQVADEVIVAFDSLGFFTVSEKSNVVTQGSWKLKMCDKNFNGVDSTMFELDLDKPSAYLFGVILPCENQVMFWESYTDGCNTFFEKE